MSAYPETETWRVTKPVTEASGGVVTSQNYLASRVGASVLRSGGNAVDAAVAASFAISTVEPWMSGLGGGGYMLVYLKRTDEVKVVSFGMKSPIATQMADYPLVEGRDSDLFSWPRVVEDRNVKGPLSIAVPGQVAGMAAALEQFGTRSWSESIQPAIALARNGLAVDWYATLKIAGNAADLADYAETKRIYLPNGFPPAADWASPLPTIQLGNLAETLERLSVAGPDDFYRGKIASSLVADVKRFGGKLSAQDLQTYDATTTSVVASHFRNNELFAAPDLTAGPTLAHALELLQNRTPGDAKLDGQSYCHMAQALIDSYEHRLENMGDVDDAASPACTSHLSVVDADGNMVALTQTLLSVFGSRVVLPGTGMLMNNGMMWFDPRPGKPNSIAPAKRPLSNMCPTIIRRPDGHLFALGASGGRRIMPAVFQLIAFLTDFGMDLDEAMHTPRIDYSGTTTVTVNNALDAKVLAQLASEFDTQAVYDSVYPSYFACPNVAAFDAANGRASGAAFVTSPWAEAAPA